jgi:Tfp pilus assembly protein FimT
MASRRISTVSLRGFTLVEMLVVIGLLILVASLSLFIDHNNYRTDAFRAEKSMLVTLLQKARADALNNIDRIPHGVAFFPPDNPDAYVVFEGVSYAASAPATREAFAASYGITFAPASPREIVFAQLSAATAYDGDIVISDPQRGLSAAISINREGMIGW